MGAGASTGVAAAATTSSQLEVQSALATTGADDRKKIRSAIDALDAAAIPTVWISSSGLPTDEVKQKFVVTVLKKRLVFDEKDEAMPLVELVAKYKETLEKCKQVHIMDALFYRDYETIRTWKKEEAAFFWDEQIIKHCGFKRENVTTTCLNMKPWLFDHAGEGGMWAPQTPKSGVTKEEEAEYMAKLQQTKDAYVALKKEPPEKVAVLASGKSCADELCEVSQKLNAKYKKAMVHWVKEVIEGADVVTAQGGDVVNLNMTFQCNQRLAKHVVNGVRHGKMLYAAHSAGAMCMAKSMEMTHEIGPGWLEAFAVSKKYLMSNEVEGGAMFSGTDLDGDGTAVNVLGALPMFETPFAMRPHFKEAWMEEVLKKNKIAEAECEEEAGIEICDDLVKDSSKGVLAALKLLNIVGKNAQDQDNPVFLPLLDGQIIVGEFRGEQECFHVIGTPTHGPANTKG